MPNMSKQLVSEFWERPLVGSEGGERGGGGGSGGGGGRKKRNAKEKRTLHLAVQKNKKTILAN